MDHCSKICSGDIVCFSKGDQSLCINQLSSEFVLALPQGAHWMQSFSFFMISSLACPPHTPIPNGAPITIFNIETCQYLVGENDLSSSHIKHLKLSLKPSSNYEFIIRSESNAQPSPLQFIQTGSRVSLSLGQYSQDRTLTGCSYVKLHLNQQDCSAWMSNQPDFFTIVLVRKGHTEFSRFLMDGDRVVLFNFTTQHYLMVERNQDVILPPACSAYGDKNEQHEPSLVKRVTSTKAVLQQQTRLPFDLQSCKLVETIESTIEDKQIIPYLWEIDKCRLSDQRLVGSLLQSNPGQMAGDFLVNNGDLLYLRHVETGLYLKSEGDSSEFGLNVEPVPIKIRNLCRFVYENQAARFNQMVCLGEKIEVEGHEQSVFQLLRSEGQDACLKYFIGNLVQFIQTIQRLKEDPAEYGASLKRIARVYTHIYNTIALIEPNNNDIYFQKLTLEILRSIAYFETRPNTVAMKNVAQVLRGLVEAILIYLISHSQNLYAFDDIFRELVQKVLGVYEISRFLSMWVLQKWAKINPKYIDESLCRFMETRPEMLKNCHVVNLIGVMVQTSHEMHLGEIVCMQYLTGLCEWSDMTGQARKQSRNSGLKKDPTAEFLIQLTYRREIINLEHICNGLTADDEKQQENFSIIGQLARINLMLGYFGTYRETKLYHKLNLLLDQFMERRPLKIKPIAYLLSLINIMALFVQPDLLLCASPNYVVNHNHNDVGRILNCNEKQQSMFNASIVNRLLETIAKISCKTWSALHRQGMSLLLYFLTHCIKHFQLYLYEGMMSLETIGKIQYAALLVATLYERKIRNSKLFESKSKQHEENTTDIDEKFYDRAMENLNDLFKILYVQKRRIRGLIGSNDLLDQHDWFYKRLLTSSKVTSKIPMLELLDSSASQSGSTSLSVFEPMDISQEQYKFVQRILIHCHDLEICVASLHNSERDQQAEVPVVEEIKEKIMEISQLCVPTFGNLQQDSNNFQPNGELIRALGVPRQLLQIVLSNDRLDQTTINKLIKFLRRIMVPLSQLVEVTFSNQEACKYYLANHEFSRLVIDSIEFSLELNEPVDDNVASLLGLMYSGEGQLFDVNVYAFACIHEVISGCNMKPALMQLLQKIRISIIEKVPVKQFLTSCRTVKMLEKFCESICKTQGLQNKARQVISEVNLLFRMREFGDHLDSILTFEEVLSLCKFHEKFPCCFQLPLIVYLLHWFQVNRSNVFELLVAIESLMRDPADFQTWFRPYAESLITLRSERPVSQLGSIMLRKLNSSDKEGVRHGTRIHQGRSGSSLLRNDGFGSQGISLSDGAAISGLSGINIVQNQQLTNTMNFLNSAPEGKLANYWQMVYSIPFCKFEEGLLPLLETIFRKGSVPKDEATKNVLCQIMGKLVKMEEISRGRCMELEEKIAVCMGLISESEGDPNDDVSHDSINVSRSKQKNEDKKHRDRDVQTQSAISIATPKRQLLNWLWENDYTTQFVQVLRHGKSISAQQISQSNPLVGEEQFAFQGLSRSSSFPPEDEQTQLHLNRQVLDTLIESEIKYQQKMLPNFKKKSCLWQLNQTLAYLLNTAEKVCKTFSQRIELERLIAAFWLGTSPREKLGVAIMKDVQIRREDYLRIGKEQKPISRRFIQNNHLQADGISLDRTNSKLGFPCKAFLGGLQDEKVSLRDLKHPITLQKTELAIWNLKLFRNYIQNGYYSRKNSAGGRICIATRDEVLNLIKYSFQVCTDLAVYAQLMGLLLDVIKMEQSANKRIESCEKIQEEDPSIGNFIQSIFKVSSGNIESKVRKDELSEHLLSVEDAIEEQEYGDSNIFQAHETDRRQRQPYQIKQDEGWFRIRQNKKSSIRLNPNDNRLREGFEKRKNTEASRGSSAFRGSSHPQLGVSNSEDTCHDSLISYRILEALESEDGTFLQKMLLTSVCNQSTVPVKVFMNDPTFYQEMGTRFSILFYMNITKDMTIDKLNSMTKIICYLEQTLSRSYLERFADLLKEGASRLKEGASRLKNINQANGSNQMENMLDKSLHGSAGIRNMKENRQQQMGGQRKSSQEQFPMNSSLKGSRKRQRSSTNTIPLHLISFSLMRFKQNRDTDTSLLEYCSIPYSLLLTLLQQETQLVIQRPKQYCLSTFLQNFLIDVISKASLINLTNEDSLTITYLRVLTAAYEFLRVWSLVANEEFPPQNGHHQLVNTMAELEMLFYRYFVQSDMSLSPKREHELSSIIERSLSVFYTLRYTNVAAFYDDKLIDIRMELIGERWMNTDVVVLEEAYEYYQTKYEKILLGKEPAETGINKCQNQTDQTEDTLKDNSEDKAICKNIPTCFLRRELNIQYKHELISLLSETNNHADKHEYIFKTSELLQESKGLRIPINQFAIAGLAISFLLNLLSLIGKQLVITGLLAVNLTIGVVVAAGLTIEAVNVLRLKSTVKGMHMWLAIISSPISILLPAIILTADALAFVSPSWQSATILLMLVPIRANLRSFFNCCNDTLKSLMFALGIFLMILFIYDTSNIYEPSSKVNFDLFGKKFPIMDLFFTYVPNSESNMSFLLFFLFQKVLKFYLISLSIQTLYLWRTSIFVPQTSCLLCLGNRGHTATHLLAQHNLFRFLRYLQYIRKKNDAQLDLCERRIKDRTQTMDQTIFNLGNEEPLTSHVKEGGD